MSRGYLKIGEIDRMGSDRGGIGRMGKRAISAEIGGLKLWVYLTIGKVENVSHIERGAVFQGRKRRVRGVY